MEITPPKTSWQGRAFKADPKLLSDDTVEEEQLLYRKLENRANLRFHFAISASHRSRVLRCHDVGMSLRLRNRGFSAA
jgi:hypothetical protein